MNKLNELGSQMLEYKSELNKDYPAIVINSLLGMVEKLAIDGVIDPWLIRVDDGQRCL